MRKSNQTQAIKGLMARLDADTNVDAGGFMHNPVSAYTCPERAQQEWQTMFADYPQVLGLSGDLPQPGSFFTSEDLGKPILATRDNEGSFRAFLNVCRHRGTMVENEKRGQKNIFSCPFHAWGYSAAGDLVSVPKEDHFGTIDKSCYGLVSLPVVERYGLLWTCANPDIEFDVDELLGDLADEFASWNLQDSKFQWDTTYDHAMNWKLANDTFGETYHFNVLHKDTLATNLYGNCQMYDTYKRNHRMLLCHRGIDYLREMPEDDWHILKATIPVYYIFPNVQLILGGGGPTLVRVYPQGSNPNDSYSQISFYTHEAMIQAGWEDPELVMQNAIERAQGFAEVIRDEDYWAAATSHKGALSGAQETVIFGRNEPALHHYHNTYREVLDLPALSVET